MALAAWPFPSAGQSRKLHEPDLTILPPEPGPWLKEWLAANRVPILNSEDPSEQRVIAALRAHRPLGFVYLGGSEPERWRQVHPVMLYHVHGYPGAYLSGFCELRKQIRCFRLDRMRFTEEPT